MGKIHFFAIMSVILWMTVLGYAAVNTATAAPHCSKRFVSVVAHLDDDILFINPEIMQNFDAGACITTVHLTGGSFGSTFAGVEAREQGLRKAYAKMAKVPDNWATETVLFAGKEVTVFSLNGLDNPNQTVQFFEFRLPCGGARSAASSLQNLWDFNQPQTIQRPPINGTNPPVIPPATPSQIYNNRDELQAALLAVFQNQRVTKLSTLNPDTIPYIEHPDHIYAARITRATAKLLTNNIRISYHETYPTPGRPFNVLGQELQRKRDIVASYFSIAVELGSFTESHWNGNWIPRRYQWTGHVHDNRPDWQALPFELVNALTSQCLTSKGVGTNPILSACTGAKIQKWTYIANNAQDNHGFNNAQLVNTSGNCISFGNGLFLEEPCAPHSNQYWTPWDFGIIRASRLDWL
jgi:LmbE family N-acetylglucosaminyl deacetylase